ncbi:collagen alpha-1(III) chain-like isoform X3 [Sciurus carolinensis]|uniref:collagen alpha-1(III) chain-like isoform X3 n=1 Tax=Sciurus carolinensis TaxID=30640 RepID=UPI001FB1A4FC|nr:collagen alpha-1(III) chain-like isoform X3 [Sciurus carolinensis]
MPACTPRATWCHPRPARVIWGYPGSGRSIANPVSTAGLCLGCLGQFWSRPSGSDRSTAWHGSVFYLTWEQARGQSHRTASAAGESGHQDTTWPPPASTWMCLGGLPPQLLGRSWASSPDRSQAGKEREPASGRARRPGLAGTRGLVWVTDHLPPAGQEWCLAPGWESGPGQSTGAGGSSPGAGRTSPPACSRPPSSSASHSELHPGAGLAGQDQGPEDQGPTQGPGGRGWPQGGPAQPQPGPHAPAPTGTCLSPLRLRLHPGGAAGTPRGQGCPLPQEVHALPLPGPAQGGPDPQVRGVDAAHEPRGQPAPTLHCGQPAAGGLGPHSLPSTHTHFLASFRWPPPVGGVEPALTSARVTPGPPRGCLWPASSLPVPSGESRSGLQRPAEQASLVLALGCAAAVHRALPTHLLPCLLGRVDLCACWSQALRRSLGATAAQPCA